ncbi:MAG: glycoside hydrolase family 5 protein, partial [Clostridiales bacterium]|nr:glycoside hydrolase family 5 protein [Clostridiales bacterium]
SMKIPNNDKRIIVSVHSYEPYSFALDTGGGNKWSQSKKKDTETIDYVMDTLHKTFISKGIPVVMGEFGALNKNNLSDRVAWAEYYVRAAKKKDITCIWWDNGSFSGSGENFGILNRQQNKWQYPEVVKALMKGIK